MDFKLIIIILILTLLITIVLYNIMLKKKNGIINAYSSLDVILKKRYDLIPNLVSCIKGYIEYEREVITDITSLRKKGMLSTESMDVFEINNELSSDLEKIMLICENYPDLKASENFLKLQAILNDVEENISAARRTYNAHVTNYNNFIEMFPNFLFAKLLGFKKFDLFTIETKEKEGKIWFNEKWKRFYKFL